MLMGEREEKGGKADALHLVLSGMLTVRTSAPPSGACGAQHRPRERTHHHALGNAAPAAQRRPARNQYPQHHLASLARLAEAGKPMPSITVAFLI